MCDTFQNFVLLTVEAGADQDSLSFWDWEGDALLGRVQVNYSFSSENFFFQHQRKKKYIL